MAAPPFVISTSLPGDSDIVSQFPGVDRTLRDVVVSWMQVDHNNNPGGHVKLTMDQTADPAAVSGKTVVSARTDGSIVKQNSTNPVEYVGAFPGQIAYGAGSVVPAGWFLANGQAVSRTTYATLFNVIGINYGAGDGSTTFNLPNLTDRITIGKGSTFPTLGGTGGATTKSISQSNLPNYNLPYSDPGHVHGTNGWSNAGGAYHTAGGGDFGWGPEAMSPATIGITINSGGSGAALDVMNPYITLNPYIKY